MSYHRFMSLLSGLSGDSVFFYRMNESRKEEHTAIVGAENIAADMARKMSGKRRKG